MKNNPKPKTQRRKHSPPIAVSTDGGEAYGPGVGKNTITLDVVKSLTTGQVAALCGCSPRNVQKWCDRNELPCYRIPLSRDRRVTQASLVEFMRKHKLPIPYELAESTAVKIGVRDDEFPRMKRVSLSELAALLVKQQVHAAVIGDVDGRELARAAATLIREASPDARIILYASADWRCDPVNPWSVVYYREQTPHHKVPLHPVSHV